MSVRGRGFLIGSFAENDCDDEYGYVSDDEHEHEHVVCGGCGRLARLIRTVLRLTPTDSRARILFESEACAVENMSFPSRVNVARPESDGE